MGFGGGGSSQITAHVHTNSAGQGGALTDATLLQTDTLLSQLAWGIIETYEATVAENSHLFSFPAIDFDDFSELILVMDIVASASMSLSCRINADATANYDTHGKRIFAGADTFVNQTNATSGLLCTSNVLGANQNFGNIVAHIGLPKGSTASSNHPSWTVYTSGDFGELEMLACVLTVDKSDISSIELRGSSNWKIGSRATLYRVKRQ